jgi:hypothetical protein
MSNYIHSRSTSFPCEISHYVDDKFILYVSHEGVTLIYPTALKSGGLSGATGTQIRLTLTCLERWTSLVSIELY